MKTKSIFILVLLIQVNNLLLHSQKLQSFRIDQVKLTESPFYTAQQADMNYILAMDVDRLLVPFLNDAGIETKAKIYPNWEETGLGGHIGGHYLTALSLMYAATGNQELKDRLDYMVDQLEACQQKNGNGYVGGIPDGKRVWKEVAAGQINAGGFSLNKSWVPWYNIHKLYAGLFDAHVIGGNAKALDILVKLCNWTIELTNTLSDDQMERMMRCEYGGMNDVLADVAHITGEEKYLDLAKRFSHKFILNPLLYQENKLTGLHANTQIPKVIGYEKISEYADMPDWHDASEFFWETVINEWTVSIGGNSVREHFHPANDFSSMVESNQGPETCNTYNMLKLTKLLFQVEPEAKYTDYYERALYNHILTSEHPEKGGFVYMTPMRPRHYRVYSQPHEGFWCCVGSGLENHGKYGEFIYSHSANDLYVNLFIPSVLNWTEKGMTMEQKTGFPFEEKTELVVKTEAKKEFNLKVRYPSWVEKGKLEILINGKTFKYTGGPSSYVNISRKWKDGDVVSIQLPMSTSVEYLPDNSPWASVLHGPIVLAAKTGNTELEGLWADDSRMGHVANGPYYPIDETPVIVTNNRDFKNEVKVVNKQDMTFSVSDLMYPEKYKNLTLEPFFNVHDSRYIIYFPIATPEELKEKVNKMKKEEDQKMALEKETIDQIGTGEQQPESDHNFKGEQTESGIHMDQHWRHARGWFSYELNDANMEAKTLRITYFGLDNGRTFDILLNDEILATVTLKGDGGDQFVDVDYEIPTSISAKLTNGKHRLKFQAHENSIAGGIYYIRLLR